MVIPKIQRLEMYPKRARSGVGGAGLKSVALVCSGVLLGLLPGCVEVWLLNIATPFLLNQ